MSPLLHPAKPDLSKVKFGQPVQLFNGKDLAGWKLLEPNAANGWSVICTGLSGTGTVTCAEAANTSAAAPTANALRHASQRSAGASASARLASVIRASPR